MLSIEVRGFRSIRKATLDLGGRANFLMGLNDHGKSNFLRAIHLLFTGRVEPAVPLEFERDVCGALRGKGQRQQIMVEVEIERDLVHRSLLASIKRKTIFTSEQVAVRRIWRRGGVQTGLVVRRDNQVRVYARPEERDVCIRGGEFLVPAHAPVQFAAELDRLLRRFRLHYLPSNKAASSFDTIGLSSEVKHYLLDPYARGPLFQQLSDTLATVRDDFGAVVQERLGPELAGALRAQFPGITSTGLRLPSTSQELIATDEIAVSRNGEDVPLSACGSGLQSLLMLEVLAFLDAKSVRRAHELSPHFVWLIEEPEAFLYEDLVHHVGARLDHIADEDRFTVLCTSHSREVALATIGDVAWVRLDGDGTHVVREFDLYEHNERDDFEEYARAQFGAGLVEAQLLALTERLRTAVKAGDQYILVVEGKHDKDVIEKLIEVCRNGDTPDIRVVAPVTGSQNAEHVKHSVLTLSQLSRTYVVGLLDNDYEGVGRCQGLRNELQRMDRRNAAAVLVPVPQSCTEAPVGCLRQEDGEIRTMDTGDRVDLGGSSVTIEALYDDPSVVVEMKRDDLVYDHWVPKRLRKGVAYYNLTSESAKARAAAIVVRHLARGRCGSLRLLFDVVVRAFSDLGPRTKR